MLDCFRILGPIVLAWAAWWLALAGLGMLFAHACGRRVRSTDELLAAFWSGWALALVFLMLWHFAFPVDGRSAGVVLGAGWIGFLSGARRLAPGLRRGSPRKAFLVLLLLLITVWTANHSLAEPFHYDTGLYHLPAIRWASAFPLVPGLGNLYGRLAFNQSYFLYVAMLIAGPWGTRAIHWAAGLLLLPLIARFLLRVAAPTAPGAPLAGRIFAALLLVPLLDQTNNLINLASPSPDMPVFLLSLALALELFDLVLLPPGALRSLRGRAIRIALLALAGVTVKFSFVAFGVGAAGLAVGLGAWRLRRRGPVAPWRLMAAAVVLAFLVMLPWGARDVYLSGYLAYPLPSLAVPVSWRVPRPAVIVERDIISDFARDPLRQLPRPVRGWGWVKPWAERLASAHRFDVLVPLGLIAFALVLVLVQRRLGLAPPRRTSPWLLLLVPGGALVFWFFTAPHPRFAAGSFWILAAAANALLLDRFVPTRRRLAGGMALLLVAAAAAFGYRYWPWIAPGPDGGFHPPVQPAMVRFTTDSCLTLFVPRTGDQCWDAPLPATPYPNKRLCAIVPGEIGKGFRLEAEAGTAEVGSPPRP